MVKRVRQITIVLIAIFCYLQYGRRESVEASISTTFSGKRTEYLTIVANKVFIWDEERFGKQLVEKCVDNRLNGVGFSYDYGYPVEINIEVYANRTMRRLGEKSFTICYTQNPEEDYIYNVKDDPEQFQLLIQ